MDVAQNFDHLLDPISGYNGMHDLQFKGGMDLATDAWHRGALMHLSAAGIIRPAGKITAADALHSMGMWAIGASYDFDVVANNTRIAGAAPLYRGDSGNIAGGTVACLVATGGYELVTTEFNPRGTYNENVPLVRNVEADPTLNVNNGWVTPGTIQTSGALSLNENIVGIISVAGPLVEVYSQSVIRFWPVYLPSREEDP